MVTTRSKARELAGKSTANNYGEARLERLPSEVTEMIAEFVDTDGKGWGLQDICALCLTCKDLYLKSYRTFGREHFDIISFAFTHTSLQRLTELANHRNSFGLSLSSFVVALRPSLYHLISGDKAEGWFVVDDDLDKTHEIEANIEAITLACKRGIEQIGIIGPYNSRIQAITRRYQNAFIEQRALEVSGQDISVLAHAMAAFTNFTDICSFGQTEAWGQDDWEMIAGISNESFSRMEFVISGKSNATIMGTKVLFAIAQANRLRQSKGQQLNIEYLKIYPALAPPDDGNGELSPHHDQGMALQDIDLSAIEQPLESALANLDLVWLELNPRVKTEKRGQEIERINKALRLLLCSGRISNLDLEFSRPFGWDQPPPGM